MSSYFQEKDVPLLTVVIPIYGVERYLRECIESVIRQQYENLEIILIDDGSTGLEGKICDEYAHGDKRIRVIHKENAGLVAARKTGIVEASAEYIAFLDGDDFLANDYYLKMMDIVAKEKPDLLAVSYTQYYSRTHTEKVYQNVKNGIYEGNMLDLLWEIINCIDERFYEYAIFPSTCLKIYRTELLKKSAMSVPEYIRIGEDSAFTFPYALSCHKIIVDNTITGYYYRVVDNSMSKVHSVNELKETQELYLYLLPYYVKMSNRKVLRQLTLSKIVLLNVFLVHFVKQTGIIDIHKQTVLLKKAVQDTKAFEGLGLEEYDLPEELVKLFSLIVN